MNFFNTAEDDLTTYLHNLDKYEVEDQEETIAELDLEQLTDVVICDVVVEQHPKYEDAYIESANYKGVPLEEEDICALQLEHTGWMLKKIAEERASGDLR